MSKDINIHNIRNYILGNLKYYMKGILKVPPYIQEQLDYRKELCAEDCYPAGKCVICSCPPKKKQLLVESCNPERFPDLMEEEEWEQYKNEKNLFNKET